jgi:hypothetical protein
LAAWSVFSALLTHLSRPGETFYLCPSQKKGLAEEIITPLEFKNGRWRPRRSTKKEEFAKAFVLYIKCSEKCIQIGSVQAKKKKELSSISLHFSLKNTFRF